MAWHFQMHSFLDTPFCWIFWVAEEWNWTLRESLAMLLLEKLHFAGHTGQIVTCKNRVFWRHLAGDLWLVGLSICSIVLFSCIHHVIGPLNRSCMSLGSHPNYWEILSILMAADEELQACKGPSSSAKIVGLERTQHLSPLLHVLAESHSLTSRVWCWSDIGSTPWWATLQLWDPKAVTQLQHN